MPLTSFGLLRRSVRRHRSRLAAGTALLTVWQVCETSVPVFIGLVVDHAVITGELDALLLWLGAFGVLFLCLSLCYRFGSRLGFSAAQHEMHQLRVEITDLVLSDRGVRTDLSAGEVLSLATADTDRVGAAFRTIATGIAAIGSVLLACVLLLRINPLLGAVTLAGSTLLLVVIRLLTPRISAHSGSQQHTIGRAAGMATDFVRGLRPLKGIGGEPFAIDTYRRASGEARDAGIRTARSFGEMRGISTALSGLYLALIAGLAGSYAANGDISLGDLIAVVGIAQFLAEPLATLGVIGATAAAARASAGRIADFLAAEPLTADGEKHLPVTTDRAHELRIRHAHLGGAEIDLLVRPGELTGLVVTEPALADELMTVLVGESVPQDASAELGDATLTELRLADVREQLLVVPHHCAVFAGSIGSNVALEGARPDVVRRALVASAADELVELHDDGLDHPTTSGGGTLSGGQRQRLALARALAADRPVLVLQDPTTAVDAVTEQRIALGMKQFRHTGRARSTVVLTSSPAILACADQVHLVTADAVVSGTHAELLDRADYQQAVLR